MTYFRIFIFLLSLSLLACGPRDDSPEGKILNFSELIEENPKDPVARYELGRAYVEKKEFQKAFNQLSEATRLKDDYAEAYREKGIALFYLKLYSDSEKALLKSFKLDPTQPDIASDLGSIYLKNGSMKNAFRYLKVAQTRNNNMHIVFNNLGAASAKSGKNKQALKFWNQALERNPSLPEIHVNMGVTYEKTGKKKEAIAAYQKALELDKYNAMAYYNLGVIYAKDKDFPNAIKEWETAAKLDRKEESFLNSLGWAYEKSGKRRIALAKLKQSVELSPYNSKTHFSLGRIKYDLGDVDGAIESFKKSVQLDPSFGDAYYRLGLAYDSQSQSYDAISHLLITELVYHKFKKMDLFKKTQIKLKEFFEKYNVERKDFEDLQVPETLKGYDLHKRKNRIRTSSEK